MALGFIRHQRILPNNTLESEFGSQVPWTCVTYKVISVAWIFDPGLHIAYNISL